MGWDTNGLSFHLQSGKGVKLYQENVLMGRGGLREHITGFPNLGQRFTENTMEVFLTVEKHTRHKAGHHDHGLEYNLVASHIHTIVPPACHRH